MHPAAERYLSHNRDAFHAWQDRHLSNAPEPQPSPSLPLSKSPSLPVFPSAPPKPWRKLPLRSR